MKKLFFTIVALVIFCSVIAQSRTKGNFEITPKIGISSYSEYSDDDSTKSNSGIELGATADYYFNNRWSLRSGLIFDKMGGKYSYSYDSGIRPISGFYDSTVTDFYEDKLYYISIPINANWHFGSTRKWNLNFGLSPSFLTNAEVVKNKITYDISKNIIKSFQLGLSFGIGYKIGITERFGILIDSQWFNGLTNINEDSTQDINKDFTNTGFSFNLGGVFKL